MHFAYNPESPPIAISSFRLQGTGLTLRTTTLLRKLEWEKTGNNFDDQPVASNST